MVYLHDVSEDCWCRYSNSPFAMAIARTEPSDGFVRPVAGFVPPPPILQLQADANDLTGGHRCPKQRPEFVIRGVVLIKALVRAKASSLTSPYGRNGTDASNPSCLTISQLRFRFSRKDVSLR